MPNAERKIPLPICKGQLSFWIIGAALSGRWWVDVIFGTANSIGRCKLIDRSVQRSNRLFTRLLTDKDCFRAPSSVTIRYSRAKYKPLRAGHRTIRTEPAEEHSRLEMASFSRETP